MYKKLKYYNKNRKTIGDFAMARIGHHTAELVLIQLKWFNTTEHESIAL